MSQNPKQTLTLLLMFTVALALANHALAGREVPKNAAIDDKKQPQFFIEHDRSYLVPGVGRFMYPKKGHGYNPFTYNPVTGTNSGINTGIGSDSSGSATHTEIPGGDDTWLPNPASVFPIPGSGIPFIGSPPSPASP